MVGARRATPHYRALGREKPEGIVAVADRAHAEYDKLILVKPIFTANAIVAGF